MKQQHSADNRQQPPPTPQEPSTASESATSTASAGEFEIWSNWIQQATSTGSSLAELLSAEVRLALGDAGRMLLLALLSIPIALLAWLGFTALLAWLAGSYSDSVTVGLLAFLLQQCTVILIIGRLWKRYKRSLSLPLTRQHLQAFAEGMRDHETPTPDA